MPGRRAAWPAEHGGWSCVCDTIAQVLGQAGDAQIFDESYLDLDLL